MKVDNIPQELKEKNRWILWKQENRNGNFTKIPYQPDGKKAKINDSSTWHSFEEIKAAYRDDGSISGLGFVFSEEDDIVGVDLDDCRDQEKGTLDKKTTEIVKKLNSYTEVSPSGTGVHVIVKGSIPGEKNRKGKVEIYEEKRYFTFTGRKLSGLPETVKKRDRELAEIYREHLKDTEGNSPSKKPDLSNTELSDQELISKACNAKNGSEFEALWNGSTAGYKSHSEADLALCTHLAFWTDGDYSRIERLFSLSGLSREKWEKRSDYREKTIRKAINGTTDFYDSQTDELSDEENSKEKQESEVKGSIDPDSDKNPLDRDNLPFITDHMPGFKYVDRGLRLQGEEYLPVKKAVWYQTHSMMMRTQKIELGDVITDLRFHNAFPLPSGAGKKNIVTFLDKVFREQGGKEIAKPTSLHPEQLIGKTIRRGRKNPDFEQIKGHLNDDLVIMDEAIDLFRSSKEKLSETRSYLNEAMDYYGQNRITKRMTDIPKKHRLSYLPDCNLTIFIQPFSVDEEFALQGTLRRFLIPYSQFDPDIQIDGYSKRIRGGRDMSMANAVGELREQLRKARNNSERIDESFIQVEDDAIEVFEELHKNLVFQGFAHSEKGKNFTRIIDYQLQDLLLKFSGIQAVTNGHRRIQKQDVEKGFIDLSDMLACMLEYVYTRVIGTLDYNDDWKGARKDERKCLEWLKDEGATSKDSSDVSIQDYIGAVKNICDVKNRQARRKISDHEDNGWISKKQVGKHDSLVWLEIEREDGQGGQEGHGVRTVRSKIRNNNRYFPLVKKYRQGVESDDRPVNPDEREESVREKIMKAKREAEHIRKEAAVRKPKNVQEVKE